MPLNVTRTGSRCHPPRLRSWHLRFAMCIITLLASSALAAQQPATPPSEAARLALVIRFADGRTTAELVSARAAWMWTPKFPRIASPGPNEQTALPIFAVQVSRRLVGEEVHVDVSLLLKGTDQQRRHQHCSTNSPAQGANGDA